MDLKAILDPSPDLEDHSRAGVARMPTLLPVRSLMSGLVGDPLRSASGIKQRQTENSACSIISGLLVTLLGLFDFSDFHLVAMRIMLCMCILDQVAWAFRYDITYYQ